LLPCAAIAAPDNTRWPENGPYVITGKIFGECRRCAGALYGFSRAGLPEMRTPHGGEGGGAGAAGERSHEVTYACESCSVEVQLTVKRT
jgi:hypothetical protein